MNKALLWKMSFKVDQVRSLYETTDRPAQVSLVVDFVDVADVVDVAHGRPCRRQK